MKNFALALSISLLFTACGSSSNSSSDKSGSSGGGTATPAKSNLDTTNDSTHMPAHGNGHNLGTVKPVDTSSATAK